MTHTTIHTDSAPQAIGTYSQAVRVGKTVYCSGQTPLDPKTGELVTGDIEVEIRRVFDNLLAVVTAADGTFSQVAKLTIFLTDLVHFPKVNEVMATYFRKPYPARSTIGVAQLPKGARVEIECILCLE
jgi:reactive intermediate/imine deaminase